MKIRQANKCLNNLKRGRTVRAQTLVRVKHRLGGWAYWKCITLQAMRLVSQFEKAIAEAKAGGCDE